MMAKNEKYARLFDKCQIFLVEKLLNVKPYTRLENGIFLAATSATNTQLTIIQKETVAPMVQQP